MDTYSIHILWELIYSILTVTSQSKYNYNPHFTHKETEA